MRNNPPATLGPRLARSGADHGAGREGRGLPRGEAPQAPRHAPCGHQGVGGVAVFLLVLLIGFCLALDRTKFRAHRGSRVVRNLDERLGQAAAYLGPDVPRGTTDQLSGSRHRG